MPNNDCIIWKKFKLKGYGVIQRNGKCYRAHKYYYEQKFGKVPEGLVLDHLCRDRACVNVDHLEVVTQAENVRRGNRAKLSYSKVLEIRDMYNNSKISQKVLGLLFNVGPWEISKVVNYKRWL